MIICLGLTSSGKTSFLKKLQNSEIDIEKETIVPTVGTNIIYLPSSIKKGDKLIVIQEIGGEMEPIWEVYYTHCKSVIYVINNQNLMDISGNTIALINILNHPLIKGKPLLIVINKVDKDSFLENEAFYEALFLKDFQKSFPSNCITLKECCLHTGKGIDQILDWITQVENS